MKYQVLIRLFLASLVISFLFSGCASKPGMAVPVIKEWGYVDATIVWDKVKNAEGYEIERSTLSDSNYTVVDTTRSLSIKDPNLLPNTYYYYKVRAYKENGNKIEYGEYSEVISVKTNEIIPPVLTYGTPSYTSVDLFWTQVPDATNYLVYKGNVSSNILDLYSNVNSTNLTISDLEPGSVYSFIVIAQINSGNTLIKSGNSNTAYLYTKFLPGLTDITLSGSGTTINANWITSDVYDGYEIFVSKNYSNCISNENFVKNTTLKSVTISGLTSGTTYYVGVRPFVKSSVKTFYPGYSSVKSFHLPR